MAWQLDHVQLAIPMGAESLCDDFYIGLLGFRVMEKPPALVANGGRWYERDDLKLHLGVDPHFVPAGKAHPALVVDHYDDLLGVLRDAQIAVKPDESIPGTIRCHVNDPVGNRLELIDAKSIG